ncbi:hypothetical protein AVEN_238177-1 [Araneus ventricosus]|uniref:Uncharacterized protein n=1 Tax=Araneus ventricosus TaxID=182803 RepID=A0A4Y2GAY3_ARAVE|nr:hypothetical protein AVEN_238177-1 [Araneus ventricosus]
MVWATFAAGGVTEIVLIENKMISVLEQSILPDSLLPVTLLITSGNTSDVYLMLYKILHEGERGKNSSMAISESRPECNGRPLGHSGLICLQEWASVQKQV